MTLYLYSVLVRRLRLDGQILYEVLFYEPKTSILYVCIRTTRSRVEKMLGARVNEDLLYIS